MVMQHLDIPITNYDNDKLNFKPFAKKVANGILNYKQNETLIFSIEGQWGSGKTSLMNLIENQIKKEVEILHFNPWLLTDISQVIKLFFDELIKVLSYGAFEVKLNEDIKKDLKTLANIILPESLTIKAPFINIGYKPKGVLLSNGEESLEKIKSKINGYLKELDKKIVIIIDDIDRLTDKETEFIFRLTKGIADFDNLIYILLYDKKIVAKSLQTFKQEDGEKYLEKIVQYSLSVPKPHSLTIQNLLFEKLDILINELEENGNQIFFDKDKWFYVVSKVINKFILTIRDINKIINIMSFEYSIIVEDVNLTDFFLISLIKVKNIELYELIKDNPNKFFIYLESMILDEDKKTTKEEFERIIAENVKYKEILTLLFPTLDENEFGYLQENKGHEHKYLADAYYFENYFSFSMSDDKLTHKEFKEIEKCFLNDNFEEFKKQIVELGEHKQSILFSTMFNQASLTKINDQEKYKNAFINTITVSYQLEEEKYGKQMSRTFFNPRYSFIRLSHDILKQITDIDNYLLSFYTENTTVPLLVKCILFSEIKEKREDNSHQKLNIENETQDNIFTNLKNSLEKSLENIKLENILDYSYDDFKLILLHKEFGFSLTELSKELKSFMFANDENFFKIIEKIKYWKMSTGGNEYLINKNILEELGCLEETITYIDKTDKDELSKEKQELLNIWNKKSKW
ncbi:MAG: hypothetical protein JJV95_04565 [Sulfurospirillum sp.]|nr:hypothetical protein [Sulfurospirillum sp.]